MRRINDNYFSTVYSLIQQYNIPVNTKVILNVFAINRDPEYWKDAERFKPERFAGSGIEFTATHFEYLPFGGRRRICPGISFGIANVKFLLAQLPYHFDWKLPNGKKPEDLDMTEILGIVVRQKKQAISCSYSNSTWLVNVTAVNGRYCIRRISYCLAWNLMHLITTWTLNHTDVSKPFPLPDSLYHVC